MGRTSDARERILESAETLIHEKGFHAVGINDICTRAGVQKGSFYYFFPSKQALALEVIDGVGHQGCLQLQGVLGGESSPLERLAAYFRGLHAMHLQSREHDGPQKGCALANLALEMSTQDETIRDRISEIFEIQIEGFEKVLREAQEADELTRELDPRSTAEALFALMEGKIMLAKVRDDVDTLKDLGPIAFRTLGVSWPEASA